MAKGHSVCRLSYQRQKKRKDALRRRVENDTENIGGINGFAHGGRRRVCPDELYYGVVQRCGFKKQKGPAAAPAKARFAVLVAARNEAVIGHLVDSLYAQDYPRHLYDVIVAPNNCTDATEQVAEDHGAHIFAPKESEKQRRGAAPVLPEDAGGRNL